MIFTKSPLCTFTVIVFSLLPCVKTLAKPVMPEYSCLKAANDKSNDVTTSTYQTSILEKMRQDALTCKPLDNDKELLGVINHAPCSIAGVLDSLINSTPETLDDLCENHSTEYRKLPPEESFYHNFKEDAKDIPKGKLGMLPLKAEYNRIVKARESGHPLSRNDTQWLDPELPNVKYVSKNYHKEAVYNKKTKKKVTTGVNQGTVNEASGSKNRVHWWNDGNDVIPNDKNDMGRFDRCGTPTLSQQQIAKLLAEDPRLREDFIKRAKELIAQSKKLKEGQSRIAAGEADELAQLELERLVKDLEEQVEESKTKQGDLSDKKKRNNTEDERTDDLPYDPSIDTLKLEDLLKEQIVFVEALLAKGERATDGEIATYNARAGRILEEIKRIADKINSLSVSDDEKVRIAKENLAKVKELSEQLVKLIDKALKDKVVDHLVPLPFANSNEANAIQQSFQGNK